MFETGIPQALVALGIWAVIIFLGVRWYKKYRAVKEFEKWFGEKPETDLEMWNAHTIKIKAKIVPLALEFQRADIAQRTVEDRRPYGNKVSQNQADTYYSQVQAAKAELELRKSNFWRAVNIAARFGYYVPRKLDDYLL
ncbi:hypothetical protein HY947_02350 [Candidatus Gottesmanbacteria bacterium]|nr:hypothetical protein [Candidatus Gottesmanbacteria bacterium]